MSLPGNRDAAYLAGIIAMTFNAEFFNGNIG